MIADLWQDLYFGARILLKKPGFTILTVLTLALGLALTATTMAVVNAYLLRGMPFPEANRLYHVIYAPQGQPEPNRVAALDWKALNDVVEYADSSTLARFYIGDGAETRESVGLSVAPGSLEILGVRVVTGRSFLAEDYRTGSESVALISHSLWQDRFGADPNIIGQSFRAKRSTLAEPVETFRIVGVFPPDFHYAREYGRGVMEFMVPLQTQRQAYMVRLQKGVPIAFAEERLTNAIRNIASTFPPNWQGVKLESTHTRYVAGLRPMLIPVTIAAGLVLVIISVNVAVLMLLRALRRQKEIAVRVALGAGRSHIARMLVTETFLICGTALVGGLILTMITLRLLAPIIEERLGRSAPGGASAIALDPMVLLIVGGAGALIALSLSFIPLLTPWEKRLANTLRREGRSGTDGPAMRRMRSTLIALEVALSLALLVGCGLMIRSVINLVRTDLGFQTEHLVRARIALPARTYPDAAAFMRFYDRLNERLTATINAPFALTNFIPFYETPKQAIEIDASDGNRNANGLNAGLLAVSDGYFNLFGIKIREGRNFAATDRMESEPVAIISETLARRLWPNGNAIGQRIRTADQPIPGSPLTVWRTIVGVAGDVRQVHTDNDQHDIYLPFFQAPSRYAPLYLQTDRPPSVWHKSLREVVAELDQEVLLGGENTLNREAEKLLTGPRFLMAVLTGFALFAMLLALLGIYGVTAYAVQQREREVAIRVAVGATPGAILRMFLREGGKVLAIGIAGGLCGAITIARTLANQLYGVEPFDVVTLVGACVFLAMTGLLAVWWPARQASTKSPTSLLNEN